MVVPIHHLFYYVPIPLLSSVYFVALLPFVAVFEKGTVWILVVSKSVMLPLISFPGVYLWFPLLVAYVLSLHIYLTSYGISYPITLLDTSVPLMYTFLYSLFLQTYVGPFWYLFEVRYFVEVNRCGKFSGLLG